MCMHLHIKVTYLKLWVWIYVTGESSNQRSTKGLQCKGADRKKRESVYTGCSAIGDTACS